MTEQVQQQVPTFPVHKNLWVEVVNFLGSIPWRVGNQHHTEALNVLKASPEADQQVGVNPDFFNSVINVLVDQPTAAVAPLLAKIQEHVQAVTKQAKELEEKAAAQVAEKAPEAPAAAPVAIPDPMPVTATPSLSDAQNPAVVTDVTLVAATAVQ